MEVVPLGNASRRPARAPVVTGLIILANAWVFALELMGGEAFVTRWAVIPQQIVSGHQWITIVTGMFMHVSWSHIIGNMVFLWAFAPEIEDAMGRGRYLVFYLASGVAATLAQIAVNPHSTIPVLGASGAIAAVMGAFMVMYPGDRIRTVLAIFVFVRVRLIPASLLIGVWFLSQLIHAGAVARVEEGGVAYFAHIGGFIFGVVTARLFVRSQRIAAGGIPERS